MAPTVLVYMSPNGTSSYIGPFNSSAHLSAWKEAFDPHGTTYPMLLLPPSTLDECLAAMKQPPVPADEPKEEKPLDS